MRSEAQKVLTNVADRRILRSSADAFGDYWQTYAVAVISYAFCWLDPQRTAPIFIAILFTALAAARDSRRAVNRRIDAIVRQLEEKGAL